MQNKTKNSNVRKNNKISRIISNVQQEVGLKPGQTASKLLDLYRSNNEQVVSAVKKLDSMLDNRNKITNASLTGYVLSKSNAPSIKDIRIALGPESNQVSNKVLKELIALDDWASIARTALPLIMQHGLPYLKKLYAKYIHPYMGGDEGINPIDWAGESALKPFRFSPATGENVFTPASKDLRVYNSGYGHVSSHALATVLAPENYKHRFSTVGLYKSSIGYITTQYSCTSNASGNMGIKIYPNANSSSASFMQLFNDSTFDPATGAQTPAASVTAGPFYPTAAALAKTRTVATSIEIQPSVGFNTPGIVTFGFNNGLGSFSSYMNVGLSDVRTFPFNTGGSIRNVYRMVLPYSSENDLEMLSVASVSEAFVIFVTGLGSAGTINIVVNSIIEFIPTKSYFSICPTDYPEPGPQSLSCLTQLMARFPALQQLTGKDAFRIASIIYDSGLSFDGIIAAVGEALTGITHIAAPLIPNDGGFAIQGDPVMGID